MSARKLVVLEAAEHAALLRFLRESHAGDILEHGHAGPSLARFDLRGALMAVERATDTPTRPEAA